MYKGENAFQLDVHLKDNHESVVFSQVQRIRQIIIYQDTKYILVTLSNRINKVHTLFFALVYNCNAKFTSVKSTRC